MSHNNLILHGQLQVARFKRGKTILTHHPVVNTAGDSAQLRYLWTPNPEQMMTHIMQFASQWSSKQNEGFSNPWIRTTVHEVWLSLVTGVLDAFSRHVVSLGDLGMTSASSV